MSGSNSPRLSDAELWELLSKISYKPGYRIGPVDDHPRRVRVGFDRPDIYTGVWGTGYGSAAVIAEDATAGDVVRTVFGLFKALEEHECREHFRVDGVQVFSPHITYDALIEAGHHIQGHESE